MVVNLQQLRQLLAEGVPPGRGDEDSVRRQWWAALATLQEDLLLPGPSPKGLWLAAPLPALYEPRLLLRLQGWVWAPPGVDQLLPAGAALLPGSRGAAAAPGASFQRLPLRQADGTDPLLVLITPRLQVALALEGPPEARRLIVRFEAAVLAGALQLLDRRLEHDDPAAAARLRLALQELGSLENDPDLALRFWPLLAERLSSMAPSVTLQPIASRPRARAAGPPQASDLPSVDSSAELALLEALTHEVRTPLATIRTLIRSLLRRSELTPLVRQRLEQIDGECSEQIDRFGLIFLAAELQRQPGSGQALTAHDLARTDLSQLLDQMQDLWQRQLARRGLGLQLAITPDLPPVLSDPSRLETMLGGLMDRFSRGLPSGSLVQLSLQPAGSRLKLQLGSQDPRGVSGRSTPGTATAEVATARRVGPVLSWNPSTGSLQLSRQATRQLFHRLGGRLTERGGSQLTVFFPLAEASP
ncbi:MAG: histidine kinase dimerization/phospho-acceptor domain-containing protein [Cyanobium sp.]